MPQPTRILCVCLGNICRSPACEAVLKSFAEQRGLTPLLHIDSAGTLNYHTGKPADPRMRAAAAKRGYDLTSTARQVHSDDASTFDLVLAMDRDNLADLDRWAPYIGRLERLGHFIDPANPPDIPDPYYGGDAGFDHVLDLLEQAAPNVLNALNLNT